MPTRVIRDGILDSEVVNSLASEVEVFYRRLMSVVDDYGRYYAHPSLIRAACYPLQLNKVSDPDIGKWLLATEKAGLVRVYPAQDGKRYLELQDFGQRVQSKSKFPAFTGNTPESTVIHGEPPEKTALVGVGVGVVDEGESVPRKRGRSPKVPLPEKFGLSDRVKQWAVEKGYTRLDQHLDPTGHNHVATRDHQVTAWIATRDLLPPKLTRDGIAIDAAASGAVTTLNSP